MIHLGEASAREAHPQTQVVENGSFAEACEGPACSCLANEAVAPKMQCDDEVKTAQDNERTFLSMVQNVSECMLWTSSRTGQHIPSGFGSGRL